MLVLLRSVLLALVALSLTAAPALAAAGPTVTIRIEGQDATLLARTQVATSTDPVPVSGCPGTSVAGAIEVATHGNWDHANGGFTSSILGETHDFSNNDYWSSWLSFKVGNGICSDMLSPGDDVVIMANFSGPPPDYPPLRNVSRLDGVPGSVERNVPFTVTVIESVPDAMGSPGTGTPTPAQGATVSGGGASATTNAAGRATLSLPTDGTVDLKATLASGSRTETEPVCVHDAGDGGCSTVASSPPPPHRALASSITGLHDGLVFSVRRAPRLLSGTVDPGTDGLDRVRLRLRRRIGGRCTFYSVKTERWLRRPCDAAGLAYTISTRPSWSYLLPSRLGPGHYRLTALAVDGSVRIVPATVDFSVKGSR